MLFITKRWQESITKVTYLQRASGAFHRGGGRGGGGGALSSGGAGGRGCHFARLVLGACLSTPSVALF